MQNRITVEHHFNQRSKFQQRIFWTNKLYYRNKDLPLRFQPFITQKLYWYSNGRLLQYYDEEGDKSYLDSPDGLHAYRIQAGASVRLSRKVNLTAYFMKQVEFNTSLFNGRDINDFNPNTKKIRRPFYDFSVVGISASVKIR